MRIGIDLGGSKIEILAIDSNGETLLRERRVTPKDDYNRILATVLDLVRETEERTGQSGTVGVAIPGAVSLATGRIKNANTVCLIGKPLAEDLEGILARPVRLSNDANCFALSEATDGAAAGTASVFGVILGTGVGGGIVIDHRVQAGINAIAGEWGHNPLPWPESNELPGPECYCGRRGCIESFLSGPGLARDYHLTTGHEAKPPEIVRLAEAGDEGGVFTLAHYYDRLARALAHVINILDPGVIVLGGGLSNIDALYEEIPARWGDYVFSDRVDTRLTKAIYGDSSGVRGAAWLWPEEK
ncbi:MAG TPA: ROK family protein [Gammaproteobacteria bacterium]|nr:ROK family protein [Gammaproteobacteria bacterium]